MLSLARTSERPGFCSEHAMVKAGGGASWVTHRCAGGGCKGVQGMVQGGLDIDGGGAGVLAGTGTVVSFDGKPGHHAILLYFGM